MLAGAEGRRAWRTMVVLGLGAALAAAQPARRRRHELDTLRAVGFVRRQVRGVLVTTSTTTMVIGVVVGTGLGFLVGAAGWRFTAHSAYVAGDAVFAVGRLTVLSIVGLVVATIVAVAAARSVIRRSPAAGLRTE